MPDLQALCKDHRPIQGERLPIVGLRHQRTIADRERGVVRPRVRQRARCAARDVTGAVVRDALDAAALRGRTRG